jgi:membrane protein DedA with SNARE-associated domain
MDILKSLLAEYGLWIVLLGTFFEGETVVIVAGFAAHQGLFNPLTVALLAFCGSFTGDQFWFFVSRNFRTNRYVTKVSSRPALQRALHILEKHPTAFILSFRFVYGIRNVSPVAIGLSEIPAHRFLILNAIAACVWAAAFTSVGYIFADTLEMVLGQLHKVEHFVLVVTGIAVLVYLLYRLARYFMGFQKNP